MNKSYRLKWMVWILLLFVIGCTAGQLEQAAETVGQIADPNVLGMIADANNADDVAKLVSGVGALIGSVKMVSIGAIIAGVGAILAAFKKRK